MICAAHIAACRVVEIDAIFTNPVGGSGAHAVAPECDGETKSFPSGEQTSQWENQWKSWNIRHVQYNEMSFPLRPPCLRNFLLPSTLRHAAVTAQWPGPAIFRRIQHEWYQHGPLQLTGVFLPWIYMMSSSRNHGTTWSGLTQTSTLHPWTSCSVKSVIACQDISFIACDSNSFYIVLYLKMWRTNFYLSTMST